MFRYINRLCGFKGKNGLAKREQDLTALFYKKCGKKVLRVNKIKELGLLISMKSAVRFELREFCVGLHLPRIGL